MKPLKDQEPPYDLLQKHAKDLAKEMDAENKGLDRLKDLANDNNHHRNITEKEIALLSNRRTIN